MAYQVQRLQDGQTFEFDDPNTVEQLVKSGQGTLVSPTKIYNPQEAKSYEFDDPEHANEALKSGGVLEGSHAHQVATTGKLESGARGLAQGATLGFADEIQAGIRAPFSDRSYRELRDEYRQGDEVAKEANPITSTIGEMGGGLATAFIPGLGAAKGVSTLGKIATTGAELGALSGLGYSDKESLGGMAEDTLKGGAIGGLFGGALHLGGKAISGAAKEAAGALDPTIQRFLAMGGKSKDLIGKQGQKVANSIDTVNKMGLLKRAEGDMLPPDRPALIENFKAKSDEVADEISRKFEGAKGSSLDVNHLIPDAQLEAMQSIINNAAPGVRGRIEASANKLLDDINATGGDLNKLWQLKKNTGRWVADAWTSPTNRVADEDKIYMNMNQVIGDALNTATDAIGDISLKELNKQYGALSTLLEVTTKANAQDTAASKTLGGFRFTSGLSGGATGLLGTAIGGPITGAIAGAAGAIADRGLKSAPGRLLRAQAGEALHIGQQQSQQFLMGAIPRTVDGMKRMLDERPDLLDQVAPGASGPLKTIFSLPPARAEIALRALMPMFNQFFVTSPYPSELNGRVSSPQDRMAITGQLQQMKLQPSELALRMSMLNKDGTIPPEVFAPPEEYGDEMETFASKLMKMGY